MTLGALIAYLVLSILSLLAVALVIARLPAGHFVDEPGVMPRRVAGFPRTAAAAARNGVGLLLVATGLVLSVPGLPGQGLLTMLAGLMLLDVPGRRRLERRVLAAAPVGAGLNRIRTWLGRPPFALDGVVGATRSHGTLGQDIRGKGGIR